MSGVISVRTRKRLWARSGGRCAFPDCTDNLLEEIPGTGDDTITGVECHIVAQQDDPDRVARSVSSLTPDELATWADLVGNRHSFNNLVLMCSKHAKVIDDPEADFPVEAVVEMKREHESRQHALRTDGSRRHEATALRYAEIVDEWERRIDLEHWQGWLGGVFSDGHPRMDVEDYDRLGETCAWLFSRVWPGTSPRLEEAFDNFCLVAQDLRAVLNFYPHRVLADRGIVAPTRFYNDPSWRERFDQNDAVLGSLYQWYAYLLEDLAIELTRAANLVCEMVRQELDARYRLDEGLIVLESGPYEDLRYRLHRPRYAGTADVSPYHGLRDFLDDRSGRDDYRDAGPPPVDLRLPGDSYLD